MNTSPARFTFLSGGGEMGQMIRDLDWSQTPLGPPSTWPQSLKTSVGILLSSGYPMYIAWGPRFTQIYNDAYRPILGSTKHPQALGISTLVTFREIWDFIGPMFRDVMDTGRASNYVDQLLLLERHGFREECYFTFSYSALPSDDSVGGVLVTVLETTGRVIRALRPRGNHLRQRGDAATRPGRPAVPAGVRVRGRPGEISAHRQQWHPVSGRAWRRERGANRTRAAFGGGAFGTGAQASRRCGAGRV
jgi:hypothetical protein